jgi:hypothetical protein
MAVKNKYERPAVNDYGSLTELTEACASGTGGDSLFPANVTLGGFSFGKSVHNSVTDCESN